MQVQLEQHYIRFNLITIHYTTINVHILTINNLGFYYVIDIRLVMFPCFFVIIEIIMAKSSIYKIACEYYSAVGY